MVSTMTLINNKNKHKSLSTPGTMSQPFSGNLRGKEMNRKSLVTRENKYQKVSQRFWTQHQPLILRTILNGTKSKYQDTIMESGQRTNKLTKSLFLTSRSGKWPHTKSSPPFSSLQKELDYKQERVQRSLNF